MRKITVELGTRSYPIFIGRELLGQSEIYEKLLGSDQVMVVTDEVIADLYLPRLLAAIGGREVETHILPPGEQQKNLGSLNRIITHMLEKRFDRTSCLLALGGGVVGDLTGFTAACYQRGIRFLQVPTTLLAQVDSSVGGKTAVNHELGKNMIGAFHQPIAVIADVSVLQSLPDREYRSGLAEVIKYGLIRDREFFAWLDQNIERLLDKDDDALIHAVERSCINKAEVVEADETEKALRAILNLGHTFGHAVETALDYQHWLHGEAVGLGMLMAAYMSMLKGWLDKREFEHIQSLLERTGLPQQLPEQVADRNLRELMAVDKKVSHGKLKLVLLRSLGDAQVTDNFDERDLKATLEHFSAGR